MSAVTATSLECLVHLPARAWAMVVVVVVVVVGKHRRDPALVLVSPRISVAYCTEQSHHHPSEYYHRPHSCTHTLWLVIHHHHHRSSSFHPHSRIHRNHSAILYIATALPQYIHLLLGTGSAHNILLSPTLHIPLVHSAFPCPRHCECYCRRYYYCILSPRATKHQEFLPIVTPPVTYRADITTHSSARV
ncbi:uncharacterized protein K489DRAFT_68464 [Dissoconium aciculare CBS 342.82]|uniref:Uncharacterized protein n=1 Tax=Dissoconium aciculare CBS 342.82 TaxID=1314786 RepID=A0A6J3LY16_9PEZI|nr:uncharacterized protein K489DRAFT_68464 [Dissoconium aciculare CBS 342.82]KAF1819532.1 hypothetical protein K489DRAFT_68464 [Dissoconium aciculare CBS 342.82]